METFVDIISDIGAQISKIKRCRINQQTLCRYSREKCKENTRVYPEPIKRGFGIRPNDTQRVYRPVYGQCRQLRRSKKIKKCLTGWDYPKVCVNLQMDVR